jgi:hypothetical protein
MSGRPWSLFPAAILPLALTAAAAADVPAAVAGLPAAMGLQPGNWHSAVTVVTIELLPGPAAGKNSRGKSEALTLPLNYTHEADECLDPSAPNKPFLPGMQLNDECRYEDASAAEGQWRLKAQCKSPAGAAGEMIVSGHYSPTAMDSATTITMASPEGGHARISVASKSRRTGACGPTNLPVRR